MIRLSIAFAFAAACLVLAACGGSSSSSTPTGSGELISDSATGSTTPGTSRSPGTSCTAADLTGVYVRETSAAGSTFYQIGISNTSGVDCIVSGRPALRFRNAKGDDLGITALPAVPCPLEGTVDPTSCVDESVIDLPPGGPTPSPGEFEFGQLRVIVEVKKLDAIEPCASPAVQARLIGLVYPEAMGDVTIQVPENIDLQTCTGQVKLFGYGAAPE